MTETIEIEKLVRYNATDGDILVLTPAKDLGRAQMDHLNEQMVRMCAAIKDQYGKDVSSVVLPVGFKLELISVGAKRDDLAEAYTVGAAALEFAKEWEHESSSAYRAAEAAFIAGHEFKAPKPVEPAPEPKQFFTIEEYKIWKGIDPDKPVWHGSYFCFDKYSSAEGVLDLLQGNAPEKLFRIAQIRDTVQMPDGLTVGPAWLTLVYTEGRNARRATWPPGDYISADGAEGGTLWYYTASEDEFTKDYKLGFHELGATDWEIV